MPHYDVRQVKNRIM